jgi:hypothetical protein
MSDEPAFAGLKVFDASQGVAAPHCATKRSSGNSIPTEAPRITYGEP